MNKTQSLIASSILSKGYCNIIGSKRMAQEAAKMVDEGLIDIIEFQYYGMIEKWAIMKSDKMTPERRVMQIKER